ncbi:hypothetical protein [Sphingomonas sp. Leaf412]|uniref:hypothetical protein n=1 Tax=Sphingomonas sp. Leaf412 TaxID=1736370 RepID=UPI000AADAC65|nr:hypothetical protein [Sphingomonas sp. Leaf412]
MELREQIAYLIIAALVVAGTVTFVLWKRRRDARRRRLRGIKTDEQAKPRRTA